MKFKLLFCHLAGIMDVCKRKERADMSDAYCVPLTRLVAEFQLDIAFASTDYESIQLTGEELSRPGLQLAGYFDHFEPMRLQVLGNVEMSYLEKMRPEERSAIYDRLFSYKFPA